MKNLLLLLTLSIVPRIDSAAVGAAEAAVPVWTAGEGGYHTYRIPSVIKAPDGTLLAFCEGRLSGRGDAGNIDLLMKSSRDNGRTWSEQRILWDDGANTCGNPCPVVDRSTSVIWMLLTHNLGSDHERDIIHKRAESSRTVWAMSSADNGSNWSEPVELTGSTKDPSWGWYATGPGIGIQIQSGAHAGRMVIPCDHSYNDPSGKIHGGPFGFGAHVVISDDHGKSWSLGGTIRPNCNECQVVEVPDGSGTLIMNSRSYFGRNRRTHSVSSDGGKSWTDPVDVEDLVEPVCQGSFIVHHPSDQSADSIMLFSNPASPSARVRLTVKASLDNGRSWPKSHMLHEGPAAYSCLVSLSESRVGCLYEAGKKNAYEAIMFSTVDIGRLD